MKTNRTLVILITFAAHLAISCVGQNQSSLLKVEPIMNYQLIDLSKKEQKAIRKILIKDNSPRNLKLSANAGKAHCYYFVSYETPRDFMVLDEDPSQNSYKAIIDLEKRLVLPNSAETLSKILKSLDLFNNLIISDNGIVSLISRTIIDGYIISRYSATDQSGPPVIQREENRITCTAYTQTSRGMMVPLLSKCTITIDSAYHITKECVEINPF